MLNSIVDLLFNIIDYFYNIPYVIANFDMVDDILNYMLVYTGLCETVFNGLYFIVGKNLVLLIIDFFLIFIAFKVVFAIVNLVSQFIP